MLHGTTHTESTHNRSQTRVRSTAVTGCRVALYAPHASGFASSYVNVCNCIYLYITVYNPVFKWELAWESPQTELFEPLPLPLSLSGARTRTPTPPVTLTLQAAFRFETLRFGGTGSQQPSVFSEGSPPGKLPKPITQWTPSELTQRAR